MRITAVVLAIGLIACGDGSGGGGDNRALVELMVSNGGTWLESGTLDEIVIEPDEPNVFRFKVLAATDGDQTFTLRLDWTDYARSYKTLTSEEFLEPGLAILEIEATGPDGQRPTYQAAGLVEVTEVGERKGEDIVGGFTNLSLAVVACDTAGLPSDVDCSGSPTALTVSGTFEGTIQGRD